MKKSQSRARVKKTSIRKFYKNEPGYTIHAPREGWRKPSSFTKEEILKLLPVAETLAMLDGNAFFGNEVNGAPWAHQYLPEAYEIYEANGGDTGASGAASFALRILQTKPAEINLIEAQAEIDRLREENRHLQSFKDRYFQEKAEREKALREN